MNATHGWKCQGRGRVAYNVRKYIRLIFENSFVTDQDARYKSKVGIPTGGSLLRQIAHMANIFLDWILLIKMTSKLFESNILIVQGDQTRLRVIQVVPSLTLSSFRPHHPLFAFWTGGVRQIFAEGILKICSGCCMVPTHQFFP